MREEHYIARFERGHIHMKGRLKGGLVEAAHMLAESGSKANYGNMWMLQIAQSKMGWMAEECYEIPFNCNRYDECCALEMEGNVKAGLVN